jgi:hypothetical protein
MPAAKSDDWFTFTTSRMSLRELLVSNRDLIATGGALYRTDEPYGIDEDGYEYALDDSDESWWADYPIAQIPGQVRKLALRISLVPGSLNKTWEEQKTFIGENEEVPSARDVVDGVVQYYRESGKRIFDGVGVRTSSTFDSSSHAAVGYLYTHLMVNYSWDNDRSSNLGVAVCREV